MKISEVRTLTVSRYLQIARFFSVYAILIT